jgi:LMBR1 domain-containing protein 1
MIILLIFCIGIYLIIFIASLFRSPRLDERQLDEDAEEAEEEGLLANTGRRFNATWQDITGRAGPAGQDGRPSE